MQLSADSILIDFVVEAFNVVQLFQQGLVVIELQCVLVFLSIYFGRSVVYLHFQVVALNWI